MRQTAYDVQELGRISARTCARDSPAVQVDLFSVRPLLRIRDVTVQLGASTPLAMKLAVMKRQGVINW